MLIVDDGSTDRTVSVAREHGVDHIVRHPANRGLAAAFQAGIDACLRLGADIIVNTDGDNQYPQGDIPKLVAPILAGQVDMVVADRQTARIEHFSPQKKMLQAVGSWVVRKGSGTDVPDAPSGFRAYSREAALRLNVLDRYTYTLETIIQAGKKNLAIAHVPVVTNEKLRESRLIKGLWPYVKKSAATIVRTYAMYEPLKVFFYVGGLISALGLLGVARFGYFFLFAPPATGHIQSVVFSIGLIIIGLEVFLNGILADLIASNRRLLEDTLYRVRTLELQADPRSSDLTSSGDSRSGETVAGEVHLAGPRAGR